MTTLTADPPAISAEEFVERQFAKERAEAERIAAEHGYDQLAILTEAEGLPITFGGNEDFRNIYGLALEIARRHKLRGDLCEAAR